MCVYDGKKEREGERGRDLYVCMCPQSNISSILCQHIQYIHGMWCDLSLSIEEREVCLNTLEYFYAFINFTFQGLKACQNAASRYRKCCFPQDCVCIVIFSSGMQLPVKKRFKKIFALRVLYECCTGIQECFSTNFRGRTFAASADKQNPCWAAYFFMLFSETVTTQTTSSSHPCSEENWGFDHLSQNVNIIKRFWRYCKASTRLENS